MTLARWERLWEIPLIGLALAFLVAYAWPILDPRLDPDIESFLGFVSWTVWAVFAMDFLVRMTLAEHRREYALSHWYDVLLIAVPLLRPLRLLRLLALARVLSRSATRNLVGRTTLYVVGTAIASVGLGSLAILDAETSDPDANIHTIGDALWWAATTVTTVGYGDHYPVTTQGRCVALVLMVVGIGVLGSVTAAVATWLISQVEAEREQDRAPR